MNATHETIVSKFGSRISINFRPQSRQLWFSPAGRFFDQPIALNFGVVYDGVRYGLGFGSSHVDFQYVEQHESFDRVTFRCRDFRIGIDCEFSFIAPFYPQDVILSTLPAIFVRATVRRLIDRSVRKDDAKRIDVFCDAIMSGFVEREGVLFLDDRYYLADDHIHYQDTAYLRTFLNDHPYAFGGIQGQTAIASVQPGRIDAKTILVSGNIAQGVSASADFVIAGYVSQPVLKAKQDDWTFLYSHSYADVHEVLAYAISRYEAILGKSTQFDRMIESSSLGSAYNEFLGFSMRSYAANTWWLANPAGKPWFSVWEGNCLFHSTVDVEYNLGLFYYLVWPDLLEIMFDHWDEAKKPNNISHDIGAILDADGAAYPHEMEIEENCNFILMLHAYYRMYDRIGVVNKYLSTLRTLVTFNKACDKTGNGLPNLGTANTIDDSSDDVQFAEEQIYIGVKEYAAYVAAEDLFETLRDREHANLCREEAAKIRATVDARGWLSDHYGVTLRSAFGQINAQSLYTGIGANASADGKDAYSIYTANGFLYLMLSGRDIPWNRERLKVDIVTAERRTTTPFGCTHSSVDTSNIWISQNIWRDLCAGYLGVDMTANLEKYWAFELYENQGARGGCFIDTYGWNKLNYYPRGLTAIGYLASSVGLGIDAVDRRVRMAPVRVPMTVPLLYFADWKDGRVPLVSFAIKDGVVTHSVTHGDLLAGFELSIESIKD